MSEHLLDSFEIYGERVAFVEPTNINELGKAYEVKSLIERYYFSLMNDDEEKDSWLDILQTQERYINDYVQNLGDFNNTFLIKNINYLLNMHKLSIGDLENALCLSAGYISRTAKKDSKKKMSIDVVWKISKIFDIDIYSLISRDLSMPKKGIDLIADFVDKLINDTMKGDVCWENEGGYACYLNQKYIDIGLIKEKDEQCSLYISNHLNSDKEWKLSKDIFTYKYFSEDKDLVVISVTSDFLEGKELYDLLLIWKEEENYKWELMFSTADDAFSVISDKVTNLMEKIITQEFEPVLSTQNRKIIEDFLSKKAIVVNR